MLGERGLSVFIYLFYINEQLFSVVLCFFSCRRGVWKFARFLFFFQAKTSLVLSSTGICTRKENFLGFSNVV